jgi:hypothetical protein
LKAGDAGIGMLKFALEYQVCWYSHEQRDRMACDSPLRWVIFGAETKREAGRRGVVRSGDPNETIRLCNSILSSEISQVETFAARPCGFERVKLI